jgi:hypothetical protein
MQNASLVFQYIHEGVVAGALSFGGWVIMFPLRTIAKAIKNEWKEKSALLQEVHTEMKLQRTNCLSTLQRQGEKQIDLLERAVDVLEDIHISQSEMSGYIKASKGV